MAGDPDDRSEDLDEDKIEGEFPPERPLGADDYGATPAEERVPEPLDEWVAREEPDRPPRGQAGVGELIDPTSVETTAPGDRLEASEVPEIDPRQLDAGDDFTGDESRRDYPTEVEAPRPAEEAALHLVTDETAYPDDPTP